MRELALIRNCKPDICQPIVSMDIIPSSVTKIVPHGEISSRPCFT